MKRSHTIACIALLMLAVIGTQAYMVMHGTWLSPSTSKLWYVILSFLIAILIESDRKCRGRSAPFEYSAFVFFAWPLVAPHYFFSVLRWRGLAIGIGLILLALLPDLVILYLY
jgi:hypothetical protein